jgi:hypothetical protein
MEITLKYDLDRLNELLAALGKLPFVESAQYIQEIHQQAMPQIQAQQPPTVVEEAKPEEAVA